MKSRKRYNDTKFVDKFANMLIKNFKGANSRSGYGYFQNENTYFPTLENSEQLVQFFNANKNELKKFIGQRKLNNSFYSSQYLSYSYNRSYPIFDVLKQANVINSFDQLDQSVKEYIKANNSNNTRGTCSNNTRGTRDYFRRFLIQSIIRLSAFSNKLRDYVFKYGSDGSKIAAYNRVGDRPVFDAKGKRYWGYQLDKATTQRYRKICYHHCSKEKLIKSLKKRTLSPSMKYYLKNNNLLSEHELSLLESNNCSELEDLIELTRTRGFTWSIGRRIERIINLKFDETPFMFLGLVAQIRSVMKEDRSYRYLDGIEKNISSRLDLIKLDL